MKWKDGVFEVSVKDSTAPSPDRSVPLPPSEEPDPIEEPDDEAGSKKGGE